jgi:phosphoribosylaminoimidazole-succinocarboxamide synthase
MPEEVRQYREQLEGRTMLVRKARIIPMEAIVRGYITGEPISLF